MYKVLVLQLYWEKMILSSKISMEITYNLLSLIITETSQSKILEGEKDEEGTG